MYYIAKIPPHSVIDAYTCFIYKEEHKNITSVDMTNKETIIPYSIKTCRKKISLKNDPKYYVLCKELYQLLAAIVKLTMVVYSESTIYIQWHQHDKPMQTKVSAIAIRKVQITKFILGIKNCKHSNRFRYYTCFKNKVLFIMRYASTSW